MTDSDRLKNELFVYFRSQIYILQATIWQSKEDLPKGSGVVDELDRVQQELFFQICERMERIEVLTNEVLSRLDRIQVTEDANKNGGTNEQ